MFANTHHLHILTRLNELKSEQQSDQRKSDPKAQNIDEKSGHSVQKEDCSDIYLLLDSNVSPLPVLDATDLTDPNKGLWEFWQREPPEDYPTLRGRDPAQDVEPWPVAIDFGTSSTVVAYKEGGKKHLIRVGVKDYFDSTKPEHFENPTALAFIDLDKALPQWQETTYKPSIRWGDIRCSHEALSELKDNEGDPEVTSSILTNLKHWALKEDKISPARIKDRVNQREMVLPPLELRNPIKGLPLTVSSDDNFDPIELYAYYLGLTINWRKRGIFLRYCMTFPVTYPQRIKDKILASFRRGLQRSLPETLITQDIFNRFEVEEIASEPVAFAAAALQQHNIEPTEEGVTYAVFDFGGGTTDFDFGIYREPTDDEDDEGYDIVFEHFGASGDAYLGGENLLENLAYLVFKANQSLLREHRIAISMPVNADVFPGSEMLIDTTLAALTNTQIVMSRLRSFMEQGQENNQGIEKIKLLNRSDKEVNLELEVPYELLGEYLEERIQSGVDKFFTSMCEAFNEHNHQPQEVHILLAGNASRSVILEKVLQNILGVDSNLALTNADDSVRYILHHPLNMSSEQPDKVTAKTGVALGLLDLVPGNPVKIVNHAREKSAGEAPFKYYIGRIRRGHFHPQLKRNASYQTWQEIGVVLNGRFDLVYTTSPLAHDGTLESSSDELNFIPLELAQFVDKQRLFARAIAPDKIEICTAESADKLDQIVQDNFHTLELS
ncbi:hypothetical protein [Oceanospirillum sediminis]|uniref:Molecular chaperone DnaK n=1 Tax=Oceanospirillum sediminis TaxID=2760088 RepID=A0A839ITI5_9GAMM|nr:hypothetical protein [Oceanospirillum sediminis]MBB1488625.1 hypothetical protein [Oceanospirillum sediminis]